MNGHDETRQPERIESEIEQTRAEVSSTIDAIQRKLTPGQLMDQAVDYLRTSAPADFGNNLSRSIRENPLPVALIGVGVAWLMMSGQQGGTRRFARNGQYGGAMPAAPASGEGGVHRATAAVGDAGRKVKDKLSEVTSRAGDMMSSARERVAGAGSDARARMSELGGRTREQVDRARGTMSHMLEAQPLVMGAFGIALGAALGASLPPTRREDELMGGARDDVVQGARQAVQEQADAVQDSVQRVAETARQETSRRAEDAGMSSPPGGQDAALHDRAAYPEPGGQQGGEEPLKVLRPQPSDRHGRPM
jgi:ElaB/YqjD/DUF883 family membrane-anchored ribosome-binding protein